MNTSLPSANAVPSSPQDPSDKPRRRHRRRRDRNRDTRQKPDEKPAVKAPGRAASPVSTRDRRRGSGRQKKFTGRISEHFSQRDFVCRCGECQQQVRVSLGLVGILEFLRAQVRRRINIVKGYQCKSSHDKTGSYFKNYHISGIAADIQIEGMTAQEVFGVVKQVPELKGIGLNLDLDLVHIDTRKEPDRAEWVVQKGKRIPLDANNITSFIQS